MADDATIEGPELERLQSEVRELQARNEKLERERADVTRPGKWRWPVSILLLVVGGILMAATVPALWASRTVFDTDRYTATVAPLAGNAAVRDSVAVAAVDRLFARANVEAQIRDALPPKAAPLAPAIASGAHTFALQAGEAALATPQFQTLWTEANRQAQQRIVPALLNGTAGRTGGVSVQQGTVTLDLTKVVAQVKSALVAKGLTFVANVPDTVAGGQVTLFQSAQLAQAQSALRLLQTLSIVLPILTLIVLLGAVLAAPDRRRALLWVGVVGIVAMAVLGGALAYGRNAYLGSLGSGSVLTPAAAAAFFDTMVVFLRNAIRSVAAVGLVLLIGAALAGPSTLAVRLRNAVTGGFSALGLDLGGFSVWVERHRFALDAVIVVAAAAVLFAVSTPTPGLVAGLAMAVLVGVLIVELLARAHPGPPPPSYTGQPSM